MIWETLIICITFYIILGPYFRARANYLEAEAELMEAEVEHIHHNQYRREE